MADFPPKKVTSGPVSKTLTLKAMVVHKDKSGPKDNLTLMLLEPIGLLDVSKSTKLGAVVQLKVKFATGSSMDI